MYFCSLALAKGSSTVVGSFEKNGPWIKSGSVAKKISLKDTQLNRLRNSSSSVVLLGTSGQWIEVTL